MRTYQPKSTDVQRQWHIIDASDVVLGRLASQVAVLLRGKHKPTFAPHVDTGDFVVVINADKVALTGAKPADALPFFAEQERVALVVASDADVVDARLGRAQCLRYLNGRRAEAESLLRETVPLALQSGSSKQHQAVMGVLVEVLRDASKLGEATEWLMRRRKLIDELDDLPLRVEATMQHAGICRDRGDTETSALYYQQARSLALHLGLSALAQECLRALQSLGDV